jgi:hypothetical protein
MSQTAILGEGQFRAVRLADLVTDGRFNRDVSNTAVERILSAFDAQAFGTITVWERDDGALVIIDGQHRVEAARRRGISETAKCIPAVVHRGLTLAEAAALFVESNATKLVSAFDKYRALLTAGDPETTAIHAIVSFRDLTITRSVGDGSIGCVDAVRWAYRTGEPEGSVLALTLLAIQSAWGPASEAYRSAIVRGVALYFHEHRDIEPTDLGDALARGPGAPINLIAWAKTIAGTQRMPLDRAIAQVIEQRVMKRRPRPRAAER